MQWYGYQHTDGSLHVKRSLSKDELNELYESSFVTEVFGPWDVENRAEAVERLRQATTE